tara:strand:- start:281 stop:451 length:171 start_codon:yes stop_codon:yes gene_type:complete
MDKETLQTVQTLLNKEELRKIEDFRRKKDKIPSLSNTIRELIQFALIQINKDNKDK